MNPIHIQGSKKPDQFETIIEELLEVVKNIDEWMMNYKFWKNNKNYYIEFLDRANPGFLHRTF